MPFTLVPLPFPTDALEPYIDAKTMQIHHDGHHAAYVNNLNAAIQKAAQLEGKSLEDLLANNLAIVPEPVKTAVRNNAGGDYNHRLFWELLNPAYKPGPTPVGNLANAINSAFGSFDKFKEEFTQAAMGRFGSGWAWLTKKKNKLHIISTANQDSPLMEGAFPVVGLDVWEHAYYLKYQNRRAEYVNAWWNVVNWKAVEDRFNQGK
jgi:Fe-Mn family superoxide dismutase